MLGLFVDLATVDTDAYLVVPAPLTTSAPGRPATAAPSCSAAPPGSSCPAAATSPPWSTRREPQRQLPDRAGQPAGPGRLARPVDHRGRLVVARLRPLAETARRGEGPTPAASGAGFQPLDAAPGTYVLDR